MSDERVPNQSVVSLSAGWCDLIVSLVLLAMSAYFLTGAIHLRSSVSTSLIGPATFPAVISILLIIFTLVLLIKAVRKILAGANTACINQRRLVPVGIAIVLLLVFPFAMETFGYFPSAAVWVVLFGLIAGIRKPLHLGILAAGFLGFAWLVFNKFLNTPL